MGVQPNDFDIGDFPALGSVGGGQGAPGQGYGGQLQSEFTMHSEDFPALPGANSTGGSYKRACPWPWVVRCMRSLSCWAHSPVRPDRRHPPRCRQLKTAQSSTTSTRA